MEDGEIPFKYEKLKETNDIIVTPLAEHKHTLVWMHGLGDSAEGFLEFFYNPEPMLPNKNTKVVLLNAPCVPVTCNGGMKMNSWYDILTFKPKILVNEESIKENTERIIKRIEEEAKALNGDYSKVFVGGFSQGCCMALNSAILAPFTVGGVIGLSGAAFESLLATINSDKDNSRFGEKKKNLSIFVYHGKADEVITYPHAKESYDLLIASGFQKIQFNDENKLGHSVSPTEIAAIIEYMTKVFL